jgi:hypothetical protein
MWDEWGKIRNAIRNHMEGDTGIDAEIINTTKLKEMRCKPQGSTSLCLL